MSVITPFPGLLHGDETEDERRTTKKHRRPPFVLLFRPWAGGTTGASHCKNRLLKVVGWLKRMTGVWARTRSRPNVPGVSLSLAIKP